MVMNKESYGQNGFEPVTYELQAKCYTNWAIQPFYGGGFYLCDFSAEGSCQKPRFLQHCVNQGAGPSFIQYSPVFLLIPIG